MRIITSSILLFYYYCHEWSSRLPTATSFNTVTLDRRHRIPPPIVKPMRLPTTTTTTTTTQAEMIHPRVITTTRRRRPSSSSPPLLLPSSKSSLKVYEDTTGGYDIITTDESRRGGNGRSSIRTTQQRSLLRRSIVRPLSKIARLSFKTKSRLLFVIRRLLFSIKLQFIDAATTAASRSGGGGGSTTTILTEYDDNTTSSSSSSSPSLSSPSISPSSATTASSTLTQPPPTTPHHPRRWAISSPHTNLSGTWHLIVTPDFKIQYDRYLQSLHQPRLVRNVALAIAAANTEIIEQSQDGRMLHLKGVTPKGCWIREFSCSGWMPPTTTTDEDQQQQQQQLSSSSSSSSSSENNDYERVLTIVKTADGENAEAEAWWECDGTVHKSWLRGGESKKYGGGGDFESTRYLEEDGNVLVCETVFHPKMTTGERKEEGGRTKGEIRWRFRRG